MKAAIANAVTTYAQAAGAWQDRDTATIAALQREIHQLRNRLTTAEGALRLIALEGGLTEDALPAQILAAVRGRR